MSIDANKYRSGWVYLIEANGLYKIGCTKNIPARLQVLQGACPYPIKLIAKRFAYEDMFSQEKEIHEYFERCPNGIIRIHGEWFIMQQHHIDKFIGMCSEETPNVQ